MVPSWEEEHCLAELASALLSLQGLLFWVALRLSPVRSQQLWGVLPCLHMP